ncbi:hypothetical protein [Aquibacillus kalidii]|uniref:hypothetical protein n=1 Tax=Aquibacillus kalidii TaxID=2762597 RepID=UPI0016491D40|nr:hypothetical protein [Aquibacillus kalidii]
MSKVEEYYKLSNSLLETLNTKVTKDQRQEKIDKITSILAAREALASNFSKTYTEEEKEIGTSIIALDKQIQVKMTDFFEEIKLDIKNTKKQKNSNQKYVNPYQNLSSFDGMYLDKKN